MSLVKPTLEEREKVYQAGQEAAGDLIRGLSMIESGLGYAQAHAFSFKKVLKNWEQLQCLVDAISNARNEVQNALLKISNTTEDKSSYNYVSSAESKSAIAAHTEIVEGISCFRTAYLRLAGMADGIFINSLKNRDEDLVGLGHRLIDIQVGFSRILQKVIDDNLGGPAARGTALATSIWLDSQLGNNEINWDRDQSKDSKPDIQNKSSFDGFIRSNVETITGKQWAKKDDNLRLEIACELGLASDEGLWASRNELQILCNTQSDKIIDAHLRMLEKGFNKVGIKIATEAREELDDDGSEITIDFYQLKWVK